MKNNRIAIILYLAPAMARVAGRFPSKSSQCDHFTHRASNGAGYSPILQEIIAHAIILPPFAREVLGRSLVTLTSQPANMSGYSPLIVAVDTSNHVSEVVRTVREAALRMIRSCGAAQIQFVAGAAGGMLKQGITPDEAERACKVISGFEWLSEDEGWFWFGPDTDNRLLSVAKKVLAIAQKQVDAEEIQNALTRSRRNHYNQQRARPYLIELPLSALADTLRHVPWIRTIQSDDFMLKTPIPIEKVLSDAELAIYRVMSVRGGVAARYTLRQELIDTGKVQEITLHTCLDSSPIFTCINRGVFALRGTNISPEWLVTECKAVGGDAFRAPITSEISKPADTEGYSTFRITFTKYMFDSKIWAVPAPIKRIMEERDYQVEGFDSPATFTEVSGGKKRLNNFINKLTKKGIKAGDHVLVHINPERHHIWFEKATSSEDATIVYYTPNPPVKTILNPPPIPIAKPPLRRVAKRAK